MDTVTIGFVLYLTVILAVGIYSVRITRNLKDFALGGQRLGPWVIAFSERASGESAWLLIGLPGAALAAGFFELWTVIGCVGGIIISWFIIAERLRRLTGKYNAITLPELLATKFNDHSGILRMIASIIIIFFFTFYVAAQFSGAGKVLNVTFGITEIHGMILGAVIIVFYTMLGGFTAVAWTDLIQGIIMFGTLVILPIVGFIELNIGSANVPDLDFTSIFGNKTGWNAVAGVIGGLSWGLGYMGQPHLVTRYMAIDRPENISVSRRIAIMWAVPAFFGAFAIGLVGTHLLETEKLIFNGTIINELSDVEKLMPLMAQNLLPAWLAGIFISGAIAAMMSTADSQLLVSTTVMTEDIISRLRSFRSKKLDLLLIGRILTVCIGIAGFYLAYISTDLVFEMVSYAWGGLGASFGPALVLTLWWKRTSRIGIITGMLLGTFFTVFDFFGGWITSRLSAFILAWIGVMIASLIFPDKQIEN